MLSVWSTIVMPTLIKHISYHDYNVKLCVPVLFIPGCKLFMK